MGAGASCGMEQGVCVWDNHRRDILLDRGQQGSLKEELWEDKGKMCVKRLSSDA
jgi:hypothetical protein